MHTISSLQRFSRSTRTQSSFSQAVHPLKCPGTTELQLSSTPTSAVRQVQALLQISFQAQLTPAVSSPKHIPCSMQTHPQRTTSPATPHPLNTVKAFISATDTMKRQRKLSVIPSASVFHTQHLNIPTSRFPKSQSRIPTLSQ